MDEERQELVELVRIREPARMGIYESLLTGAGIEYVVEGEAVQGLFPFASPGFFLGRGMGAVLRVRPEDLEDARRLLEEQAPLPDEDGAPDGS
ncbi:MAG: putative signal transducing protein [Thermoanaerobaculia bacterium]